MIRYAVADGVELRSMADVRREARHTRTPHWFSEDTLRWFNGRIESELIGRRWFVSSEQPPHGTRTFTVRYVEDDGSISTPGTFGEFTERQDAVDMARGYAKDAGMDADDGWVIESNWAGRWEVVSYAESREAALDELRVYRANQPEARHRIRSGDLIVGSFREVTR